MVVGYHHLRKHPCIVLHNDSNIVYDIIFDTWIFLVGWSQFFYLSQKPDHRYLNMFQHYLMSKVDWKLSTWRPFKFQCLHDLNGLVGLMNIDICSTYILLMEELLLTTWDVTNTVNNGMNYLSTDAGFLPVTVYPACDICWNFNIFLQLLQLKQSSGLFYTIVNTLYIWKYFLSSTVRGSRCHTDPYK